MPAAFVNPSFPFLAAPSFFVRDFRQLLWEVCVDLLCCRCPDVIHSRLVGLYPLLCLSQRLYIVRWIQPMRTDAYALC